MRKIVLFSLLIAGCSKNQTVKNQDSFPPDCYHCGMDIEAFKNFSAKAEGKEKYSFCSNRCLFTSLLISGLDARDKIYVMDYYTQTEIDGKKAFYVVGGDTPGPMGKDIFSFQTLESAKAYSEEHAGEQVVGFAQVDKEILKSVLSQ